MAVACIVTLYLHMQSILTFHILHITRGIDQQITMLKADNNVHINFKRTNQSC